MDLQIILHVVPLNQCCGRLWTIKLTEYLDISTGRKFPGTRYISSSFSRGTAGKTRAMLTSQMSSRRLIRFTLTLVPQLTCMECHRFRMKSCQSPLELSEVLQRREACILKAFPDFLQVRQVRKFMQASKLTCWSNWPNWLFPSVFLNQCFQLETAAKVLSRVDRYNYALRRALALLLITPSSLDFSCLLPASAPTID